MKNRIVFLAFPMLLACAEQLPDHVQLQPQAENVAIAPEPPSPNAFKLIGQVKGEAAAKDPDQASQAARNDLRNKAAALGASVVTIDEDVSVPQPFDEMKRVRVVGRAYKAVD